MPRCQRTKSKTGIYHVMIRGNERKDIFIDDEDKNRIIETIKLKKDDKNYKIYAYCIMDNHLHLVIHELEDEISKSMKRISVSYSMYFNKKYKRVGHVFQDRFKSENIESEAYLLSAIRYVHKNPEKANLGEYNKYKYSSAGEYENGVESDLVDAKEVLGILSGNRSEAIKLYKEFMNEEVEEETFIEVEEEKEIDEDNCLEYINNFSLEKNKNKYELTDEDINNLVEILLKKSNLSQRYIAKTLEISKDKVRRIALKTKSASKEPSL